MLPPVQSLAGLYSEPALRTLLETTREGFHALVYRAGHSADIEFLERALQVVEPAQMKVEISVSMHGDSLLFTTGAGETTILQTESLFGSFLRGLRGRGFEAREKEFLDTILSKAATGNPKLAAPDLHADALIRLMNVGADVQADHYLISLGVKALNKPTATPIKALSRELLANPLGMAIITGNETVFEALLSKTLQGKSPDEAAKFWLEQPALQIDSASKHTQQLFTVLDTVLLYAEPERVPNLLKICHDAAPITTSIMDTVLEKYLKQARTAEKKVIEYDRHWSRPLSTSEWNLDNVNTALSYRDPATPFPGSLLYEAMNRACYPVLEAALQAGQDDFKKIQRENGRYSPINCAKTVASSGSTSDRISRSLTAVIAGGANIDQYSDDTTALIDAAKNGRLEVAGVLLEHGADPLATDSRNWKAASSFKDRAQRAKFEQMVNSVKAQKSILAVLRGKPEPKP